MAKVITTELQHSGASGANITLDSSKNVTCENNLTVDGTTTLTGAVTLPAGTTSDTLSFRNLVINGAMKIAQRGASDTSSAQGYTTVDRWQIGWGGADSIIETHQEVLTSSDTGPWAKGFRNAYKLVNGNQSGGAHDGDSCVIQYRFEAMDIAGSGWNYTDPNSKITLSFWVKSSTAQAFQCYLRTFDGTDQVYSFSTGSLSANTWTKVTKTIPGNSNIQMDNNSDTGMNITLWQFAGADFTASVTDESWRAYSGSSRMNATHPSWWTTNDATFHITGVQLEVGDTATDFEHRSYGDELARCQRYYYKKGDIDDQSDDAPVATFFYNSGTTWKGDVEYPVTMRTAPSLDVSNFTNAFRAYGNTNGHNSDTLGTSDMTRQTGRITFVNSSHPTSVLATGVRCNATGAYIAFNAEL